MRVQSVVGVRFDRGGNVAYFDAAGFDLSQGDMVAVETDDGPREGWVVIAPSIQVIPLIDPAESSRARQRGFLQRFSQRGEAFPALF